MIDIHSHILPGVDDGAATPDAALAMLRHSLEEGIHIQWLTPHLGRPPFDRPWAEIERRFAQLQTLVEAENLSIELYLAAEIHIGPHILEMVRRNTLPCCGHWNGQPALLLELPFELIPHGTLNLIRWLGRQGIRPILAHPERLRPLQNDPARLEAFLEAGCLVQLTAASLTGLFGRPARQAATTFLQQGWVHFLASDCHNLHRRVPGLREGYRAASAIVGEAAARRLVRDHPAHLLDEAPAIA